jgi:hypothetical protein
MVGKLIMLPLRVGVRATRLWLRATEESVAVAAGVATRIVGVVTSHGSDGAQAHADEAARDWPSAPEPDERAAPEPDEGSAPSPERADEKPPAEERPEPPTSIPPRPHAEAKPAPSAEPPPAPPEPEPEHVSEEPTLVEEVAEPGAEDGAGAEVHVEPPWDGYEALNAKEVISRLASASAAELAAVQLYESGRRRRQTILNAVQRELRGRNGSGSPSQ